MVRAASKYSWIWFPAAALMMIAVFTAGCAHKPTEPQSGPDSQESLSSITRITTAEEDGAAIVRIEGTGPFAYTAVKRSVPVGVIFYLQDTVLTTDATEYAVNGDLVESISASEITEDKHTVRVEIALKSDIPYEVERAAGGLRIVFAPPGEEAEPSEEIVEEAPPKAPVAVEESPLSAEAESPPTPATRLESVGSSPIQNGVQIMVRADGQIMDYNDFTVDSPPRIVFDIFNLKSLSNKEETLMVNTPWVKRVRHYGDDRKLRLVLDTRQSYLETYSASPVDDGLVILVNDPGATPVQGGPGIPKPSVAVAPAPATSSPPARMDGTESSAGGMSLPAETVSQQQQGPVMPAATPGKPAWVNQISFSSEEAGKSTVTIGTTRQVQYQMKPVGEKLLRLTLINTNIPEYRKRALITTRFESALDRVTPLQKPDMAATSSMIFELREKVAYEVKQNGNLITVHFSASAIPPKPFEAAKLPPWKRVLEQVETVPGSEESEAAGAPDKVSGKDGAYRTAQFEAFRPVKKYTGEKIALDFYQTDIKNVFRILREVSGKNFAIDKNVTGRVTLSLDKPVPWDQILDLVLKMNQLGMIEEGDIMRIATLATIRREDQQRKAAYEAERQARAAKKAAEPVFTEYIPINYSNAKNEILPHVKSRLSKQGSVSVDGRNNQIIITDTKANIAKVRELIREIDKVTPQVLIEARVVEVNDEFKYEFGIEWDLKAGLFDPPIGVDGTEGYGPQRGYNTLGGTYNYFADMSFPAEQADSSIGFSFTRIFGSPLMLDIVINAIEANSEGRIISAPKILTLDNKKARIKQGLEFPYLERDDAGGSAVKFKDIDLLLEVTPQITPDNRISMNIFITKNDVAAIVEGVPAISTNEAETELLVNDGDTIVIGGILKAQTTVVDKGWPLLKDIPIVKWLFRTDREDRQNNELLIFITPRIVQLEQREL